MNTFAKAIDNQEARTENNMKARKSTASPCVDLFYKIGAMRNQNVIPAFSAAYVADKNVSLRIAQWARDVRGGAGERKIFRDILLHLEEKDSDAALSLMRKVPELGRWDDLLVFKSDALRRAAFEMIGDGMRKHQNYSELLNRIETMSETETKEHLVSLGIDQNESVS